MAIHLQLPQKAIYVRLKSTGILDDYIVKGYDVLHTFGKEYLMEDPDLDHSRDYRQYSETQYYLPSNRLPHQRYLLISCTCLDTHVTHAEGRLRMDVP